MMEETMNISRERKRLCNSNERKKRDIKIQDSQFIYQFELNQCYWYFYRQYCLLSTADINIDGATPSLPHSNIPSSGVWVKLIGSVSSLDGEAHFLSLSSSSLLLLYFSRGDDVVGARTSGCEGAGAEKMFEFFSSLFLLLHPFSLSFLAQRLKSIQIHRWRRHLTHRADISLLARENMRKWMWSEIT